MAKTIVSELYFIVDSTCIRMGMIKLDFSLGLLLLLFFFLGLRQWHMEVPRLGIKLELQLLAYTIATATWEPSCIWPTPQLMCNARSLTQWTRPVIEPESSWILVGFVTTEPQWELPSFGFLTSLYKEEHSLTESRLCWTSSMVYVNGVVWDKDQNLRVALGSKLWWWGN